jgi:hypothetical protein
MEQAILKDGNINFNSPHIHYKSFVSNGPNELYNSFAYAI